MPLQRKKPTYSYRRPITVAPAKKKWPFEYLAFIVFVGTIVLTPMFFRSDKKESEEIVLSASNNLPQISTKEIVRKVSKNPSILVDQLSTILGEDKLKYGIYVKDLSTDVTVGVNEDTTLPPASIYKVPLSMLIFKDIDSGKRSLNDLITLKESNKAYQTDAMFFLPNNSKFTLEEFLNYLIVQSDNTAMNTLEELLGGANKVNERFRSELKVTNFFRDPHQATAKEIGNVFEQIYNQSYLSKESNESLLDLLEHTGGWLQDRIPAGLKDYKNVLIAHKVGNLLTENGAAYADAGIVYGENSDYIIIVINEDVLELDAKDKIPQISKAVYEWVNK